MIRIVKRFCLSIVLLLSIAGCTSANIASWYAKGFDGKLTASGYVYDSRQLTCASNTYPFGTVLKVTNIENKKSVIVVVTDTGSFTKKYGREIDLSKAAFARIASLKQGVIKVKIKVLSKKHVFRYKKGRPRFTPKEYRKYVNKKNYRVIY